MCISARHSASAESILRGGQQKIPGKGWGKGLPARVLRKFFPGLGSCLLCHFADDQGLV